MGAIIYDDVIYGGGGGGSSDVELIELTQAEYDALTYEQKHDTLKAYFITDSNPTAGIIINDNTTANDKLWSSQKTNNAIEASIQNVPIATAARAGVVKIGSNINVAEDGTISTHSPYVLPTATTEVKGGVKIGSNINVTEDGIISTHDPYILPTASTTVKGGIKISGGFNVTNDILTPVAGAGLTKDSSDRLTLPTLKHDSFKQTFSSKTVPANDFLTVSFNIYDSQLVSRLNRGFIKCLQIFNVGVTTVLSNYMVYDSYITITGDVMNLHNNDRTFTELYIYYAYFS